MFNMSHAELSVSEKLEIIREKHSQIYEILTSNNIDCWIIFARETETTPDSIMDFLVGNDVVGQSAFIFATSNNHLKKYAIVSSFDANKEKEKEIWDEVIGYGQSMKEHLQKVIKLIDPLKIALDYSLYDVNADGLTHGMYLLLEEILKEYSDKFISAETLIRAIRGRKTPTELNFITQACRITEEINNEILPYLKVGLSEQDIQNKFHELIEKFNVGHAWEKYQNPMCDAGPEKEFGHVSPQSNIFTKERNTFHNDFGVKYKGYCSDLQRMWFFGTKEDVPQELRHAIETITKAIQLAVEKIRPGVKGWEIDKVARDFVVSRGYNEYMHSLGHPVGIKAHDAGGLLGPLWERYGDLPKTLLEEGQVYTIEPSLRTENFGWVALEEMIIVTKKGFKFIVEPVKDFIYV
jgi:Xaa-Pro aminopeptidase